VSPSARVGAAVVLALRVGLAAPASAQYPDPREHWRYRTDEEVRQIEADAQKRAERWELDRAVLIVLEACAEIKACSDKVDQELKRQRVQLPPLRQQDRAAIQREQREHEGREEKRR
jgi:hypothetical protein